MDFETGIDLLHKARRKHSESELWQVYLADKSNPNTEKKPFTAYLKHLNKPPKKDSGKSTKELIEWAERIKQKDQSTH